MLSGCSLKVGRFTHTRSVGKEGVFKIKGREAESPSNLLLNINTDNGIGERTLQHVCFHL